MIAWKRKAIEDLIRIQNFNVKKYDFPTSLSIDAQIRAVGNTLDQPFNLSRPRKSKPTVRERLVDIDDKPNEYIIIFSEKPKGNVKILNIKHYLEQYP